MVQSGVRFESCRYGTKAVLTSPVSDETIEEIMRRKPEELELNTSHGWAGDQIEFVRAFRWLKSFAIIDFAIEDIEPIHDLENILNLEVITYCKSEVRFSAFASLQSCSLEWRPKAHSIFNCTTLVQLFVNRFSGKSITPFGKLIGLESLTILNSPVSNLVGIENLLHLESLRLGGLRKLQSLEGLERLFSLKKLEIQTCTAIRSLDPLSRLHNLEVLNISNNGEILSLSPLSELQNLKTLLFYESTNIADGNLDCIFSNGNISMVSFQNRRHYTHKLKDFTNRFQE